VTFGGYSAELKKMLDRMICLVLPFFTKVNGEVHHARRYDRYPRLVGVGVLPARDAESERLFAALVARNAINMHTRAQTGFVARGEDSETIRERIRGLLEASGVAIVEVAA
jgi:hypothetical protein